MDGSTQVASFCCDRMNAWPRPPAASVPSRCSAGFASHDDSLHRSDDLFHRRAPVVPILGKFGPSDKLWGLGAVLPHIPHLLWDFSTNARAYSPRAVTSGIGVFQLCSRIMRNRRLSLRTDISWRSAELSQPRGELSEQIVRNALPGALSPMRPTSCRIL